MAKSQEKISVADARRLLGEPRRGGRWILKTLTERWAGKRRVYGYSAYPYVGTNDPESGPVVTFRAGRLIDKDEALRRLVEFIEDHRASVKDVGRVTQRAYGEGYKEGVREARRQMRKAAKKAKEAKRAGGTE